MTRVAGLILLLGALGIIGNLQGIRAQDPGIAPSTRSVGTVANLFETLDPSSPIDGARLELPDHWTVQDVRLLRYGTEPVPVRHRAGPDNSVLIRTSSPIRGPHELAVRVRVGDQPGAYRWTLTPFALTGNAETADSLRRRQFRTVDRLSREVRIESSSRPDGTNQALDLQRASAPLLTQLPAPFTPGRSDPFTIEFWMQTNELDQVPFSSWTGEETTAYPFEFVVDQSGRLRFYCGHAGGHEALRTQTPVADGHWHHVAVVYDDAESRLRLMLDGTIVDSLRSQALPAVSGAIEAAIGGRRPLPTENKSDQRLYSGRLDEVRIWPKARSAKMLRQLKDRPFVDSGAETEKPFRLSFEEDSDPTRLRWTKGARRVPTTLTFRPPLRGLQAHTDGQSVTLRWEAESAGESRFVVERSPDGTSFTVVDRLSPLDAGTQSDKPQEMTYTDGNVPGNIAFYRVRQVSPNTDTERTTGTIKIGLGAEDSPSETVELIGNFPNPFKTSSTIAYQVEESQPITLTVWNLSGKRIATLADEVHEPGYYEQTLNADDLPSGTYFARLETAQGTQSHQMVLLK